MSFQPPDGLRRKLVHHALIDALGSIDAHEIAAVGRLADRDAAIGPQPDHLAIADVDPGRITVILRHGEVVVETNVQWPGAQRFREVRLFSSIAEVPFADGRSPIPDRLKH